MNTRPHTAIKAVELLEQESLRKLPGTISTELEKKQKSVLALSHKFCTTSRGVMSSVGKGVHKKFLHSCLMRGLGQRQEMETMTVDASIRNQAEQMQAMVARFLEAILEHGIVCQLAGGERFINSR